MMLLVLRVPSEVMEECNELKPGGAERRFSRAACSCCLDAVAVAMASEVRIKLSVDSL